MSTLPNFDLRLLGVFVAVFEMRSVGGAAQRLDMSQPGLSTALARLRQRLHDPLFHRTANGMEPTPRAHELITPIRALIQSVQHDLLEPTRFAPETSTREFRFALTDVGEGIYLPFAMRAIQQSAPGITVRSVSLPPRELIEAMATGSVDLAAGYFPDLKGGQFFQRRVGLHSFACLARADHPLIRRARLTLTQFSQFDQIVVEAPGRSQEVFERFLRARRIRRRVVMTTPHFMSVPLIVAETDAIAVVPQALADFLSEPTRVAQVELPFTPPTFQGNLYWHRTAQNDPSSRWFREALIKQFDRIRARNYDRNGRKARGAGSGA